MPELIIVGGANGSGKTTFAKPFVKERGYLFLNADEIAKDLEDQDVPNSMIKAGRIFFQRLYACLEEGKNFVVETTLSGSYINKVAQKAKQKGYVVKLIYIFLDDADLCIRRVQARVFKGGHDVPIEDIVRRFGRSKENFWLRFRGLADEWWMYYNGGQGFQMVALSEGPSMRKIHLSLIDLFLKDTPWEK